MARRVFACKHNGMGRGALEPELEMDDVYISPRVSEIFGDEAAMTMVGFVFAAQKAGSL